MLPGLMSSMMGFNNGLPPLAFNYLSDGKATSITSSVSITSVPFGTADAKRYIVVPFVTQDDGRGINSVTIGGVAATIHGYDIDLDAGASKFGIGFAIALVPTGTSGTITFTENLTGSVDALIWAAYSIVGELQSTVPVMTKPALTGNASTRTTTVAALKGGVAIGLATSRFSSSVSCDWTGSLTEYSREIETTNTWIMESAALAVANDATLSSTVTFGGSKECHLHLAAWR